MYTEFVAKRGGVKLEAFELNIQIVLVFFLENELCIYLSR